MLVGGYSKFTCVDAVDMNLFEAVLAGLVGVVYEPFAVAKQIVAGTNYKFLCNATMMTNPTKEYTAEVIIYKPLESEAVLTHIVEVDV